MNKIGFLFLFFTIALSIFAVELDLVDSFFMPNPATNLLNGWVDIANTWDLVRALPDERFVFRDFAANNVFIFRPKDRRIWDVGKKGTNGPMVLGAPSYIDIDFPFLTICDILKQKLSFWQIMPDTVFFKEGFYIPDIRFSPTGGISFGDTLVIVGRKYSKVADGRYNLLIFQTYSKRTGTLLKEGFVYDTSFYFKYLGEEGMKMDRFLTFSIVKFKNGFLLAQTIFPDVYYISTNLETLTVCSVAPPSYRPFGSYHGSASATFDDDMPWISTWTNTCHVRVLYDTIAVVCYQLEGNSELSFFEPETGKVIGFSSPIKGCLLDIDSSGRLLFLVEDCGEAIKIKRFKARFQ